MSPDNKALVRRSIEEAVNKGNLAVIDDVAAPNYVYHEPTAGEVRGPDGLKKLIAMYRTAFPDVRMTIDDQIAEGDRVVTRWTVSGTHKGELMGIAPSGKQITVTGIVITRVANGKVVEEWENYDALGMMRQIGAVTAPGKAARVG
jgi:steroid delta-isomerase-like uncharacterized protein